jgi:zinc transport system ATP-binding protein
MNKIIEVDKLSLSMGRKSIFSNMSFSINSNEMVNITGPNGSGKTHLIKMMLGLEKIHSGQITHFGNNLYGYAPQHFEKMPYMRITVNEFLKLSDVKNLSVQKAIEITEINNLLEADLAELSGGELRKVLIAKSLLYSKEILFLDEPLCWLDHESQKRFYNLIKELNKNFNFAIVLISHDTFFDKGLFSKVIEMKKS